MDGKVFPALQRLIFALREAQQDTLQVIHVLRAAEEEAALLLFKGGTGSGDATSDATPTPSPRTFVSEAKSLETFKDMADEPDIPFNFPADGCYGRAHLMIKRLAERYDLDIDSMKKAFIVGDLSVPTSYVYPGINDSTVHWGWHVAPLVNVQKSDGTTEAMVFDPSLFDHPVSVDEWKRYMNDPQATLTIEDRHVYYPGISLDDATADQETDRRLAPYLERCERAGYCK